MKKIWIITLFPDYFDSLIKFGIVGQALRGERGHNVEIVTVQLRNFTTNDYKGVDDAPYGGGPGMVIRADVLKKALEHIIYEGNYGIDYKEKLHVIFPSPRGVVWHNSYAQKFAAKFSEESAKDLVFICGRYEGIDERFIQLYVDEQISLGDFILSGGEIAVMAIVDSFMRFFKGVLGNQESFRSESFQSNLLEHPQFTRPSVFEGFKVPDVLISGHHQNIDKYKIDESLRITKIHRPDLLKKDNEE
jgi:tRNA (guanine37-N1)-methyltransferase